MVKDTVQHWDTAVQRSALVKEKLKNNINSFTIKVRYGLSSEIKAFRILHLIKDTNAQWKDSTVVRLTCANQVCCELKH